MNVAQVQRFARQIALPEVGPDGQTRIGAARVHEVLSGWRRLLNEGLVERPRLPEREDVDVDLGRELAGTPHETLR